jgi:hypothetical protein
VMFAGVQSTAAVGTGQANDSGLCVGFAAGTATSANVAVVGNQDDSSTTADTDGYCKTGECLAQITVGGGNPSSRATLSAFGTDQFTLNWIARVTTSRRNIYMAIKGGYWRSGAYDIDTNSASDTFTISGLPFRPKGICGIARMTAESASGIATANDRIALGTATSTSDERSMGYLSEDATASSASEVDLSIAYDAFLRHPNTAGGSASNVIITAVNNDGYTVSSPGTAGVVGEWQGYLTFGSAPLARLVQVQSIDSLAGSSFDITLGATPTAGNTVFVAAFAQRGSGTPAITSIQDSNGKTYTVTAGSPGPDHPTSGTWFLAHRNCDGTEGATITVTYSSSMDECGGVALEFSVPVGYTFEFEEEGEGTSTSSTVNAPSLTPAVDQSFIFAAESSATNVLSTLSPWISTGAAINGQRVCYHSNAHNSSNTLAINLSASALWGSIAAVYNVVPASNVESGAGTSNGVATATAVGRATKKGTGTASGVATASAVGRARKKGTGTAAGTSSASAIGRAKRVGAGISSGIATASAIGLARVKGTGASSGVATASAVGHLKAKGTGTAGGVATVSAVGRATKKGTGTVAGSSTASAVGRAKKIGVGTSNGVATASAVGRIRAKGTGVASGFSTASATGHLKAKGTGTANGAATASGVLRNADSSTVLSGAGTASGVATASAVGRAIKKGTGISAGISTASAVGRLKKVGTGTAAGVATASAVGHLKAKTTGTASGIATASAVSRLLARRSGIGLASGTSSATGILINKAAPEVIVSGGSQGWTSRRNRLTNDFIHGARFGGIGTFFLTSSPPEPNVSDDSAEAIGAGEAVISKMNLSAILDVTGSLETNAPLQEIDLVSLVREVREELTKRENVSESDILEEAVRRAAAQQSLRAVISLQDPEVEPFPPRGFVAQPRVGDPELMKFLLAAIVADSMHESA